MRQIIAIVDGTLSRLETGKETHAGRLFKQALKLPTHSRQIFYDPGVQGFGRKKWVDVALGRGLNISTLKIFQKISEHYREGDKIYLFGFSRGAYAARLIAGMINRIGLLQPEFATYGHADALLRLYANMPNDQINRDFHQAYCHENVSIEFLGVWDTVKALGLRIPFFHHLTPMKIEFKDLRVPRNVKYARHALSKDEDRWMYEPELWNSAAPGTSMKQMLFAGDHGVVGGHVLYDQSARKLGNFSFHWMMEEAAKAGFYLPQGWETSFPTDPCAPDHDRPLWYDYIWFRQARHFIPPEYFDEHASIQARIKCKEI